MATPPIFSIIVPSFNQGQYLQACLESILEQGFPSLEILLLDGGSTDQSTEIIRRFEPQLSFWRSHPDQGQAAAIVEGIAQSRGTLITWLNSDDILLPGALQALARAFRRKPHADVFYGDHIVLDETGRVVERYPHPPFIPALVWRTYPYLAQPGTAFTSRIWDRTGGFDTSLHCSFDYQMWLRFLAADGVFVHVPKYLAGFRHHPEAKTSTATARFSQERAIVDEAFRERQGGKLERKAARLAFHALHALSGSYLRTLSFRIAQRRLKSHQS